MKWIRDATGRFPERPFYDNDELDLECQGVVEAFLTATRGEVRYPITTNDLTILVEREASDMDIYGDPTDLGGGVEGMTEFFIDRKPRVRILRDLSEQAWRENRLRTTLTHELGHVKFHARLVKFSQQLSLFASQEPPLSLTCHRDAMITADIVDWMEWQAGYASGAFLMPIGPTRLVVCKFLEQIDRYGPLSVGTAEAADLIRRMQRRFRVSDAAARVRLLQLGHLTEYDPGNPLFAGQREP